MITSQLQWYWYLYNDDDDDSSQGNSEILWNSQIYGDNANIIYSVRW